MKLGRISTSVPKPTEELIGDIAKRWGLSVSATASRLLEKAAKAETRGWRGQSSD